MRQIISASFFNRGLVSPLGLARSDQKRVMYGARTMVNWMPRVLGSMALRPGTQYLGATYQNNPPRYLPFVFSTTDTALIELTNQAMRVWINDVLLTRAAVGSTITNGTFAGNITGWTDGSDSGGLAQYLSASQLQLTSNGTARAIGYQQVTVAVADHGKEHALRIVITHGPVTLRIGSSNGDDDYIGETSLDTGTYSIAFTPTGNFYVQFISVAIYQVMVGQCTIEAAGVVTLPTPFLTADLGNVRAEQSADVVFMACGAYQQRKIERRGTHPGARGWGISIYQSNNGPFNVVNVTPNTISSSATTGNVTLTAATPLFKSTDVGRLFSLTSTGQTQTAALSAQNTFTASVVVTGVGNSRNLGRIVTGTWSGTISFQQSIDNATWTTISTTTINFNQSYLDGLDNQTIYYRMGFETGNYVSGTAHITLTFSEGTQRGLARLTAYSTSVSVSAEVLAALGSTGSTADWESGMWSDTSNWPTAVRIHQGRLWWFGNNGIWGSVSDAYYSFDETVLGDAGPIIRTIGSGPVDVINWAVDLPRMLIGAQGSEISLRSDSIDTPITPTNFTIKINSKQGSAAVEPVRLDQSALFVQRGAARIFELGFDTRSFYGGADYNAVDMTALVPELNRAGITRMAFQRQPDTRIHCCLTGQNPTIMIRDPNEDVICWLEFDTDGTVADVVTLPGANGSIEDQVYYAVQRTIGGATVYYLEKWAKETECRGTFSDTSTLNKQADAFIVYGGAATATITGLGHLNGKQVIAWGDGKDLSPDVNGVQTTYPVIGDRITLNTTVSNAVVGLPYTGQWESTKLGLSANDAETVLVQQKKISHLGFVMAYVHAKGLRFGADFDHLRDLPSVEGGAVVALDTTREVYDEQEGTFPGEWETDLTLCLQAKAPRPVTVMAAVADIQIHT